MAQTYSAFINGDRIAAGPLGDVTAALAGRALPLSAAVVFDDETGEPVRLNSHEDLDRALAQPSQSTTPETLDVRLLPRHRVWLERQQGGPSAAIRRLVEAARRDPAHRAQQGRQAAYRFISMLAGDFAGYEEACRGLFAGDLDRFRAAAASWPTDIREHALRLAGANS
jgi:hypothetical protein